MKKDNSITFIDEAPQNIESFKSLVEPYRANGTLVCFDDYEQQIDENISLYKEIWTVLSHHLNVTPIAVLHNIFAKQLRTISLNTHRLILTKSLRDASQLSFLSRQCYPHIKNFLPAVYQHCLKLQDYPYLILNFAPGRELDNYIKVSTKIFKHEQPMVVFRENQCRGGGNPYEKLILINENLYNILSNGREIYADKASSEISSSENNNVQNVNIDNTNSRAVEYSSADSNNKPKYNESSPTKENTDYGENSEQKSIQEEKEQNVPFTLPPISEVFKSESREKGNTSSKQIKGERSPKILKKQKYAKNNPKVDFKREVGKAGYKTIERNEVNEDQNAQEDATSEKNTANEDEMIELEEKRITEKDFPKQSDFVNKQQKHAPAKKNLKRKLIPKINRETYPFKKRKVEAEMAELENSAHLKPDLKRRATPKINRERFPYKKRNIESSTNDAPSSRTGVKRKGTAVFNRELHPFKALKANRGDKRKLDELISSKKRAKSGDNKIKKKKALEYDKWNI